MKSNNCLYCGSEDNLTRDHIIPISSKGSPRNYSINDTVTCCSECNSILGNIMIHTIEGRAEFINGKLRIKYSDILKTKDWTEYELAQLDKNLSSSIKSTIIQKKQLQHRLAHSEKIANGFYNSDLVANLSGLVTRERTHNYSIIESICSLLGTRELIVVAIHNKTNLPIAFINDIWDRYECEIEWRYWLMGNGFSLDTTTDEIRNIYAHLEISRWRPSRFHGKHSQSESYDDITENFTDVSDKQAKLTISQPSTPILLPLRNIRTGTFVIYKEKIYVRGVGLGELIDINNKSFLQCPSSDLAVPLEDFKLEFK